MRLLVAVCGVLAATAVTLAAASAERADTRPRLTQVLYRAAQGDASALRAIALARRTSDGARAEAIDQAISAALTTNPDAVLGLVAAGHGLPGAGWYCQDRSVEPAEVAHRRFVRAATMAVRAIHTVRLGSVRAQCLASLRTRNPNKVAEPASSSQHFP